MAKKKTEATPYLWKEELFQMEISDMIKNGVAFYATSCKSEY